MKTGTQRLNVMMMNNWQKGWEEINSVEIRTEKPVGRFGMDEGLRCVGFWVCFIFTGHRR